MKSEEFNRYLSNHEIGVFSLKDAARILGKPRHYTVVFLARANYIDSAERGLYYLHGTNEYQVASNVVYPSYVSLISALRFHNLTEQIPHIIYVLSYKRHRRISDLNGYEVEFRVIKKELMYGYSKIDDVFVASPEKAVVDMLYLNEFTEYAEELVESGKVRGEVLREYAARTGRKSVISKVGRIIRQQEEVKPNGREYD